MERGSYSRLDKLDQVNIELTEQSRASFAHELSESPRALENQIDYVLVYETLKDTCELDEDSFRELRRRATWRNTFESCLESKFGLVLQRKAVAIEEVSYFHLVIYL